MERGAAKLAKLRLAQTDAAPFPAPRTDGTARSTGFKSNGHGNGNGNGNGAALRHTDPASQGWPGATAFQPQRTLPAHFRHEPAGVQLAFLPRLFRR